MIPYMIGKLAPSPTHSTGGLVKYVPGRGYFRDVPSQNGDKIVTSPPPPSIVERVELYRAITEREEASSAANPEGKALASEPVPEAPRFPSSSPEAFLRNYFHLAAPAQLAIPLFPVSA